MGKKRSTTAEQAVSADNDVNGDSTEIPKKIDVYITPEEWEIISAAMQRENFKVKAVKGPWALAKILSWIQLAQEQQRQMNEIEEAVASIAGDTADMNRTLSQVKKLIGEVLIRVATSPHDQEYIDDLMKERPSNHGRKF